MYCMFTLYFTVVVMFKTFFMFEENIASTLFIPWTTWQIAAILENEKVVAHNESLEF